MKKPKIIIDRDIPYIKGRLEPYADTVYVDQFGFTPEIVADADAMIIRTRTRCNEALLKDSKVKIIATATIGMDQFDLLWCKERGIITRNAPGCNAPGVAQYVWASLLRNGFNPEGSTLGVVGYGNIGSIVADWGEKLGARVLISDPPKRDRGELTVPDTPLETLLRESDAVTLHVPATNSGKYPTFHLIDTSEFELMRPGTILVNAARGPVVSNPAWVEAIRTRGIRAIVDVWEGEPEINRDLLNAAEVATCHIAGYSAEGKQRATRMALQTVADYFGRDVDTSDLAPDYLPPAKLSAETIAASFDPNPVTNQLKSAPERFDTLRKEYIFRPEVRTK